MARTSGNSMMMGMMRMGSMCMMMRAHFSPLTDSIPA